MQVLATPHDVGRGAWHSKALLVSLPGTDWLIRRRFVWVADGLEPQCIHGACAWQWLNSDPSCYLQRGADPHAHCDLQMGWNPSAFAGPVPGAG